MVHVQLLLIDTIEHGYKQESLVKRGKDIDRKRLHRKHEQIVRVSPLQLYYFTNNYTNILEAEGP